MHELFVAMSTPLVCCQTQNQLDERNKLTLIWVLDHEKANGNEVVDEGPKVDVEPPMTGPESFCGMPGSNIKIPIRKWEDKEKSLYWLKKQGVRQAKPFIDFSKHNGIFYLSV